MSEALRELSLSEAGALAFKAARGAGMEWGLAEEARASVIWTQSRGLAGLAALVAALDAVQGTLQSAVGAADISVIHAGAAVSDHGFIPPEGLYLPALLSPILILPFVSHLPGVYLVEWDADGAFARVTLCGGDIWCAGPTQAQGLARVSITPLAAAPAGPAMARCTRAHVHTDHLKRLEAYAAATYAPATEASRARGAGGAD